MPNHGQQQYRELRDRLKTTDFFKRNPAAYWRRTLTYGSLHILAYLSLFIFADTPWRWLALFVLALTANQFYYISHDAGHYAISDSKNTNLRLGHIGHTFIAGGSFRFWQYKHDIHHRFCNEEPHDPDMNTFFLKLYETDTAPKPAWVSWIVQRQSYWLWILAMFHNFDFQRLSWIYAFKNPERCRAERILVPLHIVVYLAMPIALLGWQMALANYMISTMASGFILATLFATNHIGMPGLSGSHSLSFIEQQTITSRNVLVPAIFDDYFGGLNYQIEHHLFPWVSIDRYRAASPIVKEFCAEHSIAYTEESFGLALGNVQQHLLAMSKREKKTRQSGFR
ncbi:MAG: acyl-CoA desaturase [Phormidesmis sp.]